MPLTVSIFGWPVCGLFAVPCRVLTYALNTALCSQKAVCGGVSLGLTLFALNTMFLVFTFSHSVLHDLQLDGFCLVMWGCDLGPPSS